MQIKCKYCGVDLYVEEGETTITCDCCGLEQTVLHDHSNDNHVLELSSEANSYRLQSRFDEAINLYKHLIEEYPEDCELKWCLTLCEYGITYVDDKKTEKKIPTCNRTINQSIFDNVNYKYIMEHASLDEKQIYESEAKIIDKIQKNILALAKKNERYDIFICYKETDENKKRTKDSQYASLVYEKLRALGYKVFFAKETLKNKIGQEYEPIIYSALRSARVMLVFGTKKEYMDAPWVRNEWSRFLAFREEDPSKGIAPCVTFDNMYDIPEELQAFEAVHLNELDYMQKIVNSIKSLFGYNLAEENIKIQKKEEKITVDEKSINAVKMALIFGDYQKAETQTMNMLLMDFNNKELWDLLVQVHLQGTQKYNDKAYKSFRQLLTKCESDEERTQYKNKYPFLLKLGDYDEPSKRVVNTIKETPIVSQTRTVEPVNVVSPVNKVEPIKSTIPNETSHPTSRFEEHQLQRQNETNKIKEQALKEQASLFQESKTVSLGANALYLKAEENYKKGEYFKAVDLLKRAGKLNHTKSIIRLADCYYLGNGVLQDYTKAFNLYYEMAIRGNVIAQNKLAECFDNGIGTNKDPVKAYRFYRKASLQGDMNAQRNLAYCYKLGKGVDQDLKKAIKWLYESAKQGDSFSQNSLGYCFENGILVHKDNLEAFNWYKKAAEQNDNDAECNLGIIYYYGNNEIPQDFEKAAYWFMKASDENNPVSDYYLSNLYKEGKIGGRVDLEKSFSLLMKSALKGYSLAQYNLGKAYEEGELTETDIDSAYYWYHKASVQNYPDAIKALERFES